MARLPKKKVESPELLPCKCGDEGHIVRPRGPRRWGVYCLNPACDHHAAGYDTETEAIEAWNKEVNPIED